MVAILNKILEKAMKNNSTVCVNININDVVTTRLTCDPTEIIYSNGELTIDKDNFECYLDCSECLLSQENDALILSADNITCCIDFIN